MTQMMQVIYYSCIIDHMWVNRYVPIQQESLCNIYIKKLKTYCKHTQHHNFGKSRPIRHAIWLFWGSHGFPHRFTLWGGGSFPIKKFRCIFFGNFEGKNDELSEKGGSLQSKKFVAKKRNIVFRNEGRGGGDQSQFGVFPKIHSHW